MNTKNRFLTFLFAVSLSATAQAQPVLSTLVNFAGTNGGNTQGTMILGNNGNFYGTTDGGGNFGKGTVFMMTTNGNLTTLVSFAGTNGAYPYAGLTLGSDGNFYGTTYYGGDANRYGSIFMVTTNGVLTNLALFNNSNGARPQAGLTFGTDGNLYGTTEAGGNTSLNGGYGYGTVFKITTNGVLTSLFSFSNTNGAYPYANLTLGNDGAFYGTTFVGGNTNIYAQGWGTVFRITTNGQFTSLVNFGNTNGARPQGQLLLGGDGNFYGTTYYGSTNLNDTFGHGTIFKVSTNGMLTSLISFDVGGVTGSALWTNSNGGYPTAELTKGNDGRFYGTTYQGGLGGYGTVYSITTNGVLTSLGSFSRTPDGGYPYAGLTLGNDGNFYGTTTAGGNDFSGYGTVFQLALVSTSTPPVLSITTLGSQPVVVWVPSVSGFSANSYTLQTTTNLASGNWVDVTDGVPVSAIMITNSTGAAFFRLH